jgi:sec-independent protein translocase protein TatA
MSSPMIAFLGTQEVWIILGVLLLFFGAKKLPELARGLGRSVGEFKTARQEFEEEINKGEEIARTERAGNKKTDKAEEEVIS